MARPAPDRKNLRMCEELAMLFGRTRKMFVGAVSRALEAQGESSLEWQLLAFLVMQGGPRTQSEIASMAAMHPAGVSRMLDDLEARRLVRRKRDPDDRRKVRVEPTAEGKARVEAQRVTVLSTVDHVFRGLSYTNRVALKHLLEKVVAVYERDEAPAAE